MFVISHAAHGYLASVALHNRIVNNDYKLFLWLCIFFSVFPDIDGVFSTTVAGHHSILHTPMFWIVLCGLIYVISQKFNPAKSHLITLGIFLGATLHIITDWITARTVGIQWLYPFSGQNFYVYSIYPEQGQIPVFEMITDPYWSFYMENKVLFGFEIGLNFLALIFLIKNSNLLKMKGSL